MKMKMKINLDRILYLCNEMEINIGADSDVEGTTCNLTKRHIIISPKEIALTAKELDIPVQDVADTILIHELGHFMVVDYKDEDNAGFKEIHEVGLDSDPIDILYVEDKAWSYAKEIKDEHFKDLSDETFKKIKKYALETYIDLYMSNM